MGLRKEGHRTGSQGCVAARRAICPSVNTHSGTHTHTHTHRHTPSALSSHRFTHTCPDGLRHTQRYTHATIHTHTHKYKGTLRHINTRCPHKHTRVPVRSHAPLCSGFLPCIKCRNTASGWIVEAGRVSVAYHKTGPCLTLLSHQDETPREHCTPWAEGLGFLCEGVGQAPVCLPMSPQDRPLRAGGSGGLRAGGLPPPV